MKNPNTFLETPTSQRPALREIRNVRNARGDIVGRVESLADGRFRATWSVSGAWGSAVLDSLATATYKISVEIRNGSSEATSPESG